MLKRGAEAADDLGDAAKAKRLLGEKKATESGKPGARSTRVPRKDIECFNKPKGMSDKEFERQLKEQQDAINNMDADKMLDRRQAIRDAGGTKPLRDLGAQSAARSNYQTRASRH